MINYVGEKIGQNCEVVDQVNEVLTIRNKNTGDEFFVDDKFFLALKQYNHSWYVDSVGYVRTSILDKPFYKYLHHFILNVKITKDDDIVVDHIDHNPLNNTLSNIRIVSYSVNSVNLREQTNRFIGVYFQSSTGSFRVSYKLDGKTVSLLAAKNEEECALVYDKFIYQTFGLDTKVATNFSTFRYPKGFLEERGIYSPNDILSYKDIKTIKIENKKSNYFGVNPNKNGSVWDCWVTVNHRSKYIGSKHSEIEAAIFREKWLDEHPDNKSRRNHITLTAGNSPQP